MVIGRILQGIGLSAPRTISIAMVRDSFSGDYMAKIMSFIVVVFILVPVVAPAIGKIILDAYGWKAIFNSQLLIGFLIMIWLWRRQPETLPIAALNSFSISKILLGVKEICGYRTTVGYTLSAGCVFGGFVGYLSCAQQIFQTTYGLGSMFPLYFGLAALAIGSASICNSKLVMQLGMRYLSWRALISLTLLSGIFLIPSIMNNGVPPLWFFMAWLLGTFFCIGMLFGNFNALLMEPLGHMAGLGAALTGSVSTLISLPLGWLIGHLYDGNVLPLVGGFALMGSMSLMLMRWTEQGQGLDE